MRHSHPTLRPAALTSLLLVLAVAPAAEAARFRVDSKADAADAVPGDGFCATIDGACTLRAAIQESNALPGKDRIRLPAGQYGLTRHGAGEDASATGDLDVRGNLRVLGAGPDVTIVDGKGIDRVFEVTGRGRVVLARLAVRGGKTAGADTAGGGIAVGANARLTLRRALVELNESAAGGGIASQGRLDVRTSTVRFNTATIGGGLAAGGEVGIHASTFNDNVASGAGGITGQDILGRGAGSITLVNSTVTGQIQRAVVCATPPTGCVPGPDFLLANATVKNVSHAGPGSSQFTMRNSIVEECDAELVSQGYNFVAQEGCVVLGDLSGVVVGDTPLLGSLRDRGGPTETRAPSPVSDAVDGGHPAPPGSGGFACELYDQRGVERPLGLGCDMGAVEAG